MHSPEKDPRYFTVRDGIYDLTQELLNYTHLHHPLVHNMRISSYDFWVVTFTIHKSKHDALLYAFRRLLDSVCCIEEFFSSVYGTFKKIQEEHTYRKILHTLNLQDLFLPHCRK